LAGARIVFVLRWATLGGAERQALAFARSLRHQEGAEAEILALTEQGGGAVDLARTLAVPWRPFPLPWKGSRLEKARQLARLVACLRGLRPRLLLPYAGFSNVIAGLIWPWTGARACIWRQGDDLPIDDVSSAMARRAVEATPFFVANSRYALRYLVTELGAPEERARLVGNGVFLLPPESDRAVWRARLGISSQVVVACMLARLHRHKDHSTLLRAWRIVERQLSGRGERAVLLLAGTPGGAEEALKALAFDLGLSSSARFLGEVRDVAGLLSACDVGVLSSRSESCPNAILEYMAAGLPVAGTDVPGIREAVGEKGAAFLAPPGDVEGLAAALLGLVASPRLRQRLAQEGKERAGRLFDLERSHEEQKAVLVEALTAARPSLAGLPWRRPDHGERRQQER